MLNWYLILLAPIWIVILMVYYRKLKIAGALIQAGSDAFNDLPSCFIIPWFTFAMMALSGF